MSTNTFNKKLLPYAISLAVAGPTAGLVQAQGTLVLEEITVTAQKREESLQEAPIAITAFGEQTISKYSVGSVKELVKFAPNVAETAGPLGGDAAQYFIRGIGQTDNNAATDPGVGTYLDGVYLGRTGGASLDLLDVERIEILRGPQGTLFGRNTIGGAVSIITADPTMDAIYGKVRGVVGERHRYEGAASINVPFTDTMAGRFSILSKQQDGWGERVYDDETMGDIDTLAGRAKFLWDVTPDFSALLSFDATENRGTSDHVVLTGFNPAGGQPIPGATPLGVPFPTTPLTADTSSDRYDNFSSIDPRYDTDIFGTSLTLDWNLDLFTIKSITAFRELEQDITNDYDGTRWTLYDNNVVMDQEQFSQEFQFSGLAFNDRINWLLGLYWYEEEVDYLNKINLGTNIGNPFVTPQFGPGISNNQAFTLDIESYAIFGQATWDISDRFSLTLGFRYNDEEKEQAFDFFIDNTAGVASFLPFIAPGITPTLSPNNPLLALPPVVPTTYDESWDSFDPKVSLEYQASEQALFYLSYAEGFRSGGFNGRPNSGNPMAPGVNPSGFVPVNPYDPEEVKNWELGLKSEWFDNRLRLNAALFYADYQDKQILVINPQTAFFDNENAAEATITGAEVEFVALLTEALEVNGGLGHTDAEYDELSARAIATGIDKSDELQVTPKWTANLGLQYTWFMDENGSFSARADYSYRDEVYYGATNAPLEYQGSISITNVRFEWTSADETWSAAVYGLNVLDEEYFRNGQDVRDALGVAFGSVNPPPEWGLEVNYNF